MNKFSDISYRYIKYNRKRSYSIIIEIMISVFLIFGIGTFGLSVYNNFIDKSKAKGDYVVIFNNVNTKKYNELKENENTNNICAIDTLEMQIPQKKGQAKKLIISEFDDLNQNVFSYSLCEGNFPESSNEIMIEDKSRYYLDKDYQIGDYIKLGTESKQKSYKITGFFTSVSSDDNNTILSAITIKDNEIVGTSNIYVDFKKHRNIKEIAKSISNEYEINILTYNEEMMSFYLQSDNTSNITLLIFLCCCLLILFSQFIIRNTIHMSVIERTQSFGVLRCIGISQKNLKKILYKEAFILGTISVILGITFSYLILKFLEISFFSKTNFEEYFKIRLYPSITIISIVLIFISLTLALLEPIKILKKISPLQAVKNNFAVKKENIKSRKVGSKIFNRLFGIEGEYAYKNIMRNKGSFITILIAFTLSISLFTAFNGILKTMIKDFDDEVFGISGYYDACIYMAENYENKLSLDNCLNELSNIYGVEDVKPIYLSYSLNPDISCFLSTEYKDVEDLSNYNSTRLKLVKGYDNEELSSLKGNISQGNFNPDDLKDNEVIISNYGNVLNDNNKNKKVKFFNINIGDKINIRDAINSEGSNSKFEVVAIIDVDPLTGESPEIIFSKDSFLKIAPKNSNIVQSINIKLKNSEISRELREYIKNNSQYEEIQYYNSGIELFNKIKSLKLFTNALLIVIAIVSLSNILNSMASKQILRKKELALLRVIGMNKKKLCKMIVLENSLVLVISIILGLIIGNIIGYSFIWIVSSNDSNYIIPFTTMLLSILTVIILTLIFSIFSVVRIKKQNIVQDIRDGEN